MLTTNAALGVIKTNSMDASRFIALTTTQVTAAAAKPPDKEQNTRAHNWREIKGCRWLAAFANLAKMGALSCYASLDLEIKWMDRSVWAIGVNLEKPKLFADYQVALPNESMMSTDTASAIMDTISLITLN